MAIFRPGERFRYHRILSKRKNKRNLGVVLSLTAMVDMFTVLVIFLLQNYNTTGEILYLPKEVTLPKASSTKDLKPAFVITVSNKEIFLDKNKVADFATVKQQEEWMIQPLYDELQKGLVKSKSDYETNLQNRLKNVVDKARGVQKEDPNAWRKVTIQADKDIDLLSIKKVMFTIIEAGAGEVNFAVTKIPSEAVTN